MRWIGYSSADDTWENARDILTPVLIEHFERLRDSCAGNVRTALRLQLASLGAQREQHERLLGADGAAWLHKAGHHASSESAEDDSEVETAMRWWLSAQWSDEGVQQPAQKCPKRPGESQEQLLATLKEAVARMGGSPDMVRRTHQQKPPQLTLTRCTACRARTRASARTSSSDRWRSISRDAAVRTHSN